jgi:hypothetical protein
MLTLKYVHENEKCQKLSFEICFGKWEM